MHFFERARTVGIAVVAAALASGVVGVSGSGAYHAKKRKPIGTIEVVDDKVDRGRTPLRGTNTLIAGDLIATRSGGEARLKLDLKDIVCVVHDRSRVSVRPSPKLAARLLRGEITCATNLSDQNVDFADERRTRVAMRDPIFSLVAQKGRTIVKVRRGTVVVTGRGGVRQAVALGRDQQTVVPIGRSPEPAGPARFTKAEREANAELAATLPPARDTRSPLVTIGQRPDRDANVVFTFSADEPRVMFSCELDSSGFHPCSSPFVRTLPEGPHSFAVRAVDPTGNVGPTATHDWAVNQHAPIATLTKVPPPLSASATASFSFTADEPRSTFRCSLDGTAFAPCLSPVTHSGLSDGRHTFSVEPVDEFGLAGGAVNYPWTIDTRPPLTFITSGPAQSTDSPDANFTFFADELPANLECEIDNAGYSPCTSPKHYLVGGGTHTFNVRATDTAGNIGSPARYSWVRFIIT